MKRVCARTLFRMLYPIFLVSLQLLLGSSPMLAQMNTGTIYGTIVDADGAVIPNATITLTNVATGLTRTLTTGPEGRYDARALPIGQYNMTTSAPGFRQTVLEDITLHIGESLRYDLSLEVGELREVVSVSAAAELLQHSSAEVSDLIEKQRVVDLPLNRREYITLALLSGGATGFSGTSTISGRQVNAPLIMVAGQRENRNLYRLNGVPILSVSLGTLPLAPSIDAIEEFQIITTGASAEHGFQTGGQIMVATRSGRNTLLHGVLYEFLRNDTLDARNFFDDPGQPIPKFRRNQFGASLGGAFIRDKAFWFVNYEGLREVKARPVGTVVPSQALVNGDFSELLPTQILDPNNGFAPFPGNIIPPARFNAVTQLLLQSMPLPNRTGATNFAASPSFREKANQASGRVDYHLSNSDTLWGAVTWTNNNPSEPFPTFMFIPSLPSVPGFGTTTDLDGLSVSLHEVHIFQPNLINSFRVGYTRTYFAQTEPGLGTDFGIQGATTDPAQIGSPEVAIAGFAHLGSSVVSDVFTDNLFDFADDVTYVKGRHSFKFGGEFVRQRSVLYELFPVRGVFVFAPAFTGNAFADFMLGLPAVGIGVVGESNGHNFQWWSSLYAQDEWRVTSSLTLNLGLRYNYFSPWKEEFGQKAGFDTSFPGGRLIVGCDSLSNCPSLIPGFLDSVPFALASEAGWPRNIRSSSKTDFAPRVGFAWSPTEKFVVRGGYGIYYSPRYVLQSQGALETPPFQQMLTGGNPGMVPIETLLTTLPMGFPSGIVIIVEQDGPTLMSQQRFLGLQYSARSDLMFELQYVGSNTVHLPLSQDVNQPPPGPGPLNARAPFPLFGSMLALGHPVGRSNYNALTARLVKRPTTDGLTVVAAWTYSHSIDDASLDQIQSGISLAPQNSNDMRGQRGNSNFDYRHRFVVSSVYELPIGAGTNRLNSGVAGALLGYWKIGSIFTYRGGQPVTIELAADNTNTGNYAADRPDFVCDPNANAPNTADEFFNTECFAAPPPFTFGSVGRNTVTGPDLRNLDLSLLKDIPLGREGLKLEFRAEFFNITNHPNFLEVNRFFGSTGFGAVIKVGDAREVQFGLKLHF